MKSIGLNVEIQKVINKSKFLTFLIKINSEEEAKSLISNFKSVYKDATHVCSAYIVEGHKKANDDGEPSGTAGLPILNVLDKNELDHVLAVVVRYFGGIKLGAGGLVRAYSGCVRDALSKTNISDLVNGFLVTIRFDYDMVNSIDRLILDTVIQKNFDEKITYTFKVSEKTFEKFPKNIEILKKEPTLL